MYQRISSLDAAYKSGDLSVYPNANDTYETLYRASNNAETVLKQSLGISGKYIIVEDASVFPDSGLIKLSPADGKGPSEVIHYFQKMGNQFHELHRGFSGFQQKAWIAGSKVTAPIMAEHHNALKDAIVQIEKKLGVKDKPDPTTLHANLKNLERQWLSPRPAFKVYPSEGSFPLEVRFQNFSAGHGIKFLWDFGDGTNSTQVNPHHTYFFEGNYNIKLTIISSAGAVGTIEKKNFIKVTKAQPVPFFYARPIYGWSEETRKEKATIFEFVDQTDTNIKERHWFFGDGEDLAVTDIYEHSAKHIYKRPGQYLPSLLLKTENDTLIRTVIQDSIMVA